MATITTMTGAQFDAMPYEEGRRWELINGELISVSTPTWRHQDIVFRILLALRRYLERSKIAGLALGRRHSVWIPIRLPSLAPRTSPLNSCRPRSAPLKVTTKCARICEMGTLKCGKSIRNRGPFRSIYRGEISRSVESSQQVESDLLPGFVLPLSSLFE